MLRRFIVATMMALLATPALSQDSIASADTVLTAPDGRAVPVRVTWPRAARGRLPLLVLSHGANGTLDGLALFQRGLTRGRIVAAPRHPDSEANPDLAKVDRNAVLAQRMADMVLVLDSVPALERLSGTRIDTKNIAAGGHSYGALIAQALGGAEVMGRIWRDARVRRVVAFSPPGPFPPLITASGWAKIAVPQFVETGTADVVPPLAPQWQAHMVSFDAANVPGSVLWVGNGVDHYFGNRIQRLTRVAPHQGAQFAAAIGLADAFLRGTPLKVPSTDTTERLTRK